MWDKEGWGKGREKNSGWWWGEKDGKESENGKRENWIKEKAETRRKKMHPIREEKKTFWTMTTAVQDGKKGKGDLLDLSCRFHFSQCLFSLEFHSPRGLVVKCVPCLSLILLSFHGLSPHPLIPSAPFYPYLCFTPSLTISSSPSSFTTVSCLNMMVVCRWRWREGKIGRGEASQRQRTFLSCSFVHLTCSLGDFGK